MGLNDLYGFVDPQLTYAFNAEKKIILSLIVLSKSFLLTFEYSLSF